MRDRGIFFYIPRLLTLLFAVFISMFALDVFQEGFGFWKTILALGIHLIPTGILLVVLVVAWRHGWVGAVGCAALGCYIIARLSNHASQLLIGGPLIVIAVLFLWEWLTHRNRVAPL